MGYITKEISYHYATEHDIYIVFSEMVRTLQQFNDFLLKIAHFEFYDSPITHFHFPWSCKFFCRENCYPTTKGYIYICVCVYIYKLYLVYQFQFNLHCFFIANHPFSHSNCPSTAKVKCGAAKRSSAGGFNRQSQQFRRPGGPVTCYCWLSLMWVKQS